MQCYKKGTPAQAYYEEELLAQAYYEEELLAQAYYEGELLAQFYHMNSWHNLFWESTGTILLETILGWSYLDLTLHANGIIILE